MSWFTPARLLKGFAASAAGFLLWLTLSDQECITAVNRLPLETGEAPAVLRGELCGSSTPCEPALLLAGTFEYGMTGRILFELADQMKYADGRTARWLCLLSAGGNLGVANQVARGLRHLGLSTCVVPITDPSVLRLKGLPSKKSGTECASACVTLFLGGQQRLLHDNASIAVHQGHIDGGAGCKAYYFRATMEDVATMVQRVAAGSPIALEWKILWYATVTPSHRLHRIDSAALEGTGSNHGNPKLRGATWRLLAESRPAHANVLPAQPGKELRVP